MGISRRLVIGGLAGAALVGSAAWVGAGLLAQQRQTGDDDGGMVLKIAGGPGGGVARTFAPKIKRAPGLPEGEPDLRGLLKRRVDNSLFVGLGNVRMEVTKDSTGKVQASASNDGPTVEVTVGRDTELYLDVTEVDLSALEAGKEIEQQVERFASLESLAAKFTAETSLTAWGARTGDRVLARVVIASRPTLLTHQIN